MKSLLVATPVGIVNGVAEAEELLRAPSLLNGGLPNVSPLFWAGVLAFSAICTHQGCDVTEWSKGDKSLLCFCHLFLFPLLNAGRHGLLSSNLFAKFQLVRLVQTAAR
jgi:hypothetical protein